MWRTGVPAFNLPRWIMKSCIFRNIVINPIEWNFMCVINNDESFFYIRKTTIYASQIRMSPCVAHTHRQNILIWQHKSYVIMFMIDLHALVYSVFYSMSTRSSLYKYTKVTSIISDRSYKSLHYICQSRCDITFSLHMCSAWGFAW